MARTTTTIEKRLVEGFLKSVGAETGLYNPTTKKFKEGLESEPLYQTNLEIITQALKDGWTSSELEDFVFSRYKAGERAALLSDILPKKSPAKKVDEAENLLDPSIDYQHSALYVRYAPVYQSDVCTQRGRVDPLTTFTLRDLAEYYFKVMAVAQTTRTWPAVIGAFNWLLGQSRVDEVLTAIDIAAKINDETPVLALARFLEEAKEIVEQKQGRLLGVA
jgi:hypothetical protein